MKTIVMRDGDNACHRVETPQGLPGKLNRRSVTCLSVHKNEVIAFYKKVRRNAVSQRDPSYEVNVSCYLKCYI